MIENRPGAGGAIGARAVIARLPTANAARRQHQRACGLSGGRAGAGYDPIKNFAPVAKVSESYQILVVSASSPWKTIKDLVDDSKANPGKFNVAHTGAGGLPHLTGELFIVRSGAKMTGVPYRSGGEAVTAVLSGAVHATFESITILLPLIREGKVRALGDHREPAHAARARTADHGGSRRAELRGDDLQRHRRAGRNSGEIVTCSTPR